MTKPANYLARIERALRLIENSAGSEAWPGVADLAQEAAMSPFHFHRIFRVMTGETPQQVLARARLGGSLPALASDGGITEGAASSAYATNQSYARALKSLTGATPSELRADPDRFAAAVAALSRPASGARAVKIELVELAPLRLVAHHTISDFADLNDGFARLFEAVTLQIEPELITGLYGIAYDDPRFCPAAECRFDCAVTTATPVASGGPLHQLEIAGGAALRLRATGDYDRLHAALDDLYALAIVLDWQLAETQPLNHYHHDPEQTPEPELVSDVYLTLADA